MSAEVAALERVSLFQESVCLVGVRQVCRTYNHITYVLCQETQYGSTCTTGRVTGFLLNETPVDVRHFAGHEGFVLVRRNGVLLLPLEVSGVTFVSQFAELGSACLIELLYLGEDSERSSGVAAEVLDGLLERSAGFAERVAVSRALALKVLAFGCHAALTHDSVTDDERRTLLLGFGFLQGFADGVGIIADDLLHKPAPSLVLGSHVLGGHFAAHGRELHLVGVVEHDQIIQAERACHTACTLRDLLLHAAIGDEGVDGRVVDLAKAGVEELSRDSSTYSKRVTLSERTGGILDAALDVTLGVTGRHAAPLTEVLQVFD